MKRNIRLAITLSSLVVVLTFAAVNFAQPVAGGYKTIANTDEGAAAAAHFAVNAQASQTQKKLELTAIVNAARQVVAGSNYKLCVAVSEDGKNESFAEAVVYLDLKNKYKLTSWAASTCGGGNKPTMADGFKPLERDHAGAGLAADFAVKEESKVMKTPVTLVSIVKAEMQEGAKLGAGNFRLCLIASGGSVGPGSLAIVSMDQYSNLKLVSWTASKCVETDGDYKQVEKEFTSGVDMAADFAVREHSKDTGVPHKLVEILKREEKGMFSPVYRICMKVGEKGKTQTIQAVVSVDQYSNMKLISWEHSDCGK